MSTIKDGGPTAFIDIRQLDTDTVRQIVVQSGCDWPDDDSFASRSFRFRARRIATEAYRRGFQDGQKVNAAVGAWLDQEPS